ncbi:MAG: COX15/CtaA family protein [Balneolaceae bacterium]|nr:COX15/CtaA family protein [Balneolaceae bacterium]
MKKTKILRIWLWSGAGLIFIMLIVGGITRLTGSGLSMTDWNLLMGSIPPMNHEQWNSAFEEYKQFPEYQQLNTSMTLEEFKLIYFWEYLHRMIGRFIGLVFILPFGWFWYRGYLTRKRLKQLGILFALGALQGGMGWFMVKSGLVDQPYVSHYRLAAHLLLAFVLFAYCVWLALDFSVENPAATGNPVRFVATGRWLVAIGIVALVQIIWGALVAGLNAGYIYNTFPLMNGDWIPANFMALQPWILNLVDNPGTVQWIHRVVGTLLAGMVFVFWIRLLIRNSDAQTFYLGLILLTVLLIQYLLGIFTVLLHVPVVIGVSHQAVAMLFTGVWVALYYRYRSGMITSRMEQI